MKIQSTPPYVIFINPPPPTPRVTRMLEPITARANTGALAKYRMKRLHTDKQFATLATKAKQEMDCPTPSGIDQDAMTRKDYDRLVAMRNVLDEFDVAVDEMSCEVEIIERYIGTLMMHIACARDCCDTIIEVVEGTE